ncbi:hypothetical protein HMSSN036_83980 [Paenibacillus macerans]|nr:hypothetical protein HMSSN036_83980 [Paenibacillus macerans]
MRQTFKELGYPVKLYLYIALFAASVIGMRYVVDTQLPGGGRPPYLFLIWNTVFGLDSAGAGDCA